MFPLQDSTPRRCPPIVTWGLIIFNSLIFIFETTLPSPVLEKFFFMFGLIPAKVTHPDWARSLGLDVLGLWPFLTCMFLHGGWIHIFGNMWTLWIFGDNVEDVMGPWRFLFFYIVSGIAASLVHIFVNPNSTVPIIGASGAIAGVMGAYYTLFPKARIVIFFPVFFIPLFFEVPALFYLAFWFLEQVFSGALSLASPVSSGGIAWWAHVGGFLFGMLTNRLFILSRQRSCKRFKDEYRTFGLLDPYDRW
ncbi:rhomboid family serine protease [Dissulfuribacter thermophilus]|uniref:Rhomboid family serine protease n=1 Tax=Dissulfuribacter thermophilus TaxID=1156395 RepID=A0A1B9F8C3_9BACT|nr:rhomboid family intramembrane serine protease [Dissulfuribacter thermophilus]OCC16021.1 rhomboid family serine protease [Dissulfuribacter thermophilus]